MDATKVSPGLARSLEHAGGDELVELVVELQPIAAVPARAAPRAERIASLREAFQREAAPVEAAIRSGGGEVVGAAWINQMLRARVPAGCVAGLAALDEVLLLDVPRPLEQLDGG